MVELVRLGTILKELEPVSARSYDGSSLTCMSLLYYSVESRSLQHCTVRNSSSTVDLVTQIQQYTTNCNVQPIRCLQ